jgi:hypothetical protein
VWARAHLAMWCGCDRILRDDVTGGDMCVLCAFAGVLVLKNSAWGVWGGCVSSSRWDQDSRGGGPRPCVEGTSERTWGGSERERVLRLTRPCSGTLVW